MRKFKHYALMLLAVAVAALATSCDNDYDDTELKNEVSDLKSRVDKLEEWCQGANLQISALQGLVAALEAKDYVTGVSPVMEGSEVVGYTIIFSKSGPVTIKNGKDGLAGETPVIGVRQDSDGVYYWTVRTGDDEPTWLTDAAGNKIRTTGETGKSPVLSVGADTDGKVYWKVNGEWLLDTAGRKVQATGDTGPTGPEGSSVFLGVNIQNDDYVEVTLADGTSFKVPRTSEIVIFTDFSTFEVYKQDAVSTLKLNLVVKKTNFSAIKAELTSQAGISTAFQTRADQEPAPWDVTVTAPVFDESGNVEKQPSISITVKNAIFGQTALLKVTVIDGKGQEHSTTRVIRYSEKRSINFIGTEWETKPDYFTGLIKGNMYIGFYDKHCCRMGVYVLTPDSRAALVYNKPLEGGNYLINLKGEFSDGASVGYVTSLDDIDTFIPLANLRESILNIRSMKIPENVYFAVQYVPEVSNRVIRIETIEVFPLYD